ncbi:hypothetical protein B0H16DRAFT_1805882 [Mycena metata]|uniref:Uncharacterized protein n=1 Tax=Mycena metata TaxID=1033252 RepID=A0AAD7JGN5_9AGAR|nr:hypothetical protein B0H16DRAFT_1805882 [Mycena metata]
MPSIPQDIGDTLQFLVDTPTYATVHQLVIYGNILHNPTSSEPSPLAIVRHKLNQNPGQQQEEREEGQDHLWQHPAQSYILRTISLGDGQDGFTTLLVGTPPLGPVVISIIRLRMRVDLSFTPSLPPSFPPAPPEACTAPYSPTFDGPGCAEVLAAEDDEHRKLPSPMRERRLPCAGGGCLRMERPGMGIVTAEEEGKGEDGPREAKSSPVQAEMCCRSVFLDEKLVKGGSRNLEKEDGAADL